MVTFWIILGVLHVMLAFVSGATGYSEAARARSTAAWICFGVATILGLG